MRVKTNFKSEWVDNGAFIECKKCSATNVHECECHDVVEIEVCTCGCNILRTDKYGEVYCDDCGEGLGFSTSVNQFK